MCVQYTEIERTRKRIEEGREVTEEQTVRHFIQRKKNRERQKEGERERERKGEINSMAHRYFFTTHRLS